MLMAAGLGTRLRPFSDLMPKALLPLFGIPWAQFTMDSLAGAGVTRAVANVHHFADETIRGLSKIEKGKIDLQFSDERNQLLGSGGGLRTGAELLQGDRFFFINLDVLMDIDLLKLAHFHIQQRNRWGVEITFAIIPRATCSDEAYYEMVVDPKTGLIKERGEKRSNVPFNASFAVVERSAISHLPVGKSFEFVPEILLPLIAKKKVAGYFTESLWYDVGSPETWLATHLDLIQRLETGKLPRAWRNRIEKNNRRIAQEVWVSNDAGIIDATDWVGPSYWNRHGARKYPHHFGPSAVLYGDSEMKSYASGIGFEKTWVSV